MDGEKKAAIKPYTVWTVGDKEYHLKLTSRAIMGLERSFKTSLLDAVTDTGIPTVGVTIDLLHAAMQKFEHGMKQEDVADIYDDYIATGKTQIDLLKDVIYPLMGDAGFFTAQQLEMILSEMEEVLNA